MSDCLIVGGGVIGLSLAYQLGGAGMRVRLIDATQPGREASWAGAGILPPAAATSDDPLERLTALSNQLHDQWSRELAETTHIDNGYRRSGGIYLARDEHEASQLERLSQGAKSRDIEIERLTSEALTRREPALRPTGVLQAAYLLPDEHQLRNPRHLKALVVGCLARGVEITPGVTAEDFEIRGQRLSAVSTNVGKLAADTVCLTTGCWTGPLAARLGIYARIKPIRGQIVLLTSPRSVLSRIVNEGSRYLVPREDGRLLVGSTEEDSGFDRATTAGGVAGLLDFAFSLVPELKRAAVERYWAGLRPATDDGLPYLGRVPDLDNVFVAAGHFRGGLQLSTGTAVTMSQCILGQRPQVDLTAFRLDREASCDHPSPAPRREFASEPARDPRPVPRRV